jgi:hypothetical protein
LVDRTDAPGVAGLLHVQLEALQLLVRKIQEQRVGSEASTAAQFHFPKHLIC